MLLRLCINASFWHKHRVDCSCQVVGPLSCAAHALVRSSCKREPTLIGGRAQVYIRRHCFQRDARTMMLKLQWGRWEAEHWRRIQADVKFRGAAIASEPAHSVVRDTDFALVDDAHKATVARQCAPAVCAYIGNLRHCVRPGSPQRRARRVDAS